MADFVICVMYEGVLCTVWGDDIREWAKERIDDNGNSSLLHDDLVVAIGSILAERERIDD